PAGVGDALVANGDGTWTETRADGTQLKYATSGLLAKVVNLAGSVWTITRGSDVLKNIRDPFERRTTYAYDGSNNLKWIQDAAGRLTSFTVDGSGNLTRMIAPDGSRISLLYDADHLMRAFVDAEG